MADKTATGDEAAAIAAAVAQFEMEHSSAPMSQSPEIRAWHRAALREGVGTGEPIETSGDAKWL